MLQRHFQGTTRIAPQTADRQPKKLFLDIRATPEGRRVLHFPFQSISDIHLGSKFSRAKRVCMMLDNFTADKRRLVGDIIGGLELMDMETFHTGPWHPQVLGRLLRQANNGTETKKVPGNHEPGLMEKIGRGINIFGVNIVPHAEYTDPKDRIFRIEHGDRFDNQTLKSWYKLGDRALTALYEVDAVLQNFPLLEKFSIAASGKKMSKKFFNRIMGINAAIENYMDASPYDGIIYGHSHIKGFNRTPAGKILLNDGCCTEHVQFAVCDRDGNWGIIEYHRDRMDIEMEDGTEYSVRWKDIGLEHFGGEPVSIEDKYTRAGHRVLHLAAKMWPSKDQSVKPDRIAPPPEFEDKTEPVPALA